MQIFEKYRSQLLSTLSGLLLTVTFPRFDLEIIAWGALVPLFFAIQGTSLGKAAFFGFITGIIFYFFGLHWVINTMVNYGNIPVLLGYLILFLLVIYLAFYVSIFCTLCIKLSGGRPIYFAFLAPFIWTALEYIRSTPLEYGFSWLGLGYSQYKSLAVIQIAEIAGVYGVSAMIVGVNSTLHFIINAKFKIGSVDSSYNKNLGIRLGGVTVMLLILCLGFGFHSLNQYESSGGEPIKVSLIQGNIAQEIKWDHKFHSRVIQTYKRLTLQGAKFQPDLMVWPEAATPYFFGVDKKETKALKSLMAKIGSPLLLGSPYYKQNESGKTLFNSAYLLGSNGETKNRYDKIHLVPFGEFVPMPKVLFFVEKMVHGIGSFGRGNHETIFHLGDVPFGVSICYEIIFPDLVRRPINSGARFLVNITNDAWFGNSAASYQHFSMAALRAVENRVPIVRAANTGISGIVDATGKMHEQTKLFQEAIVNATIIPSSGKPTIYSQYGDWFCWLSLLVCVVAGVLIKPSSN